MAKTILVIDDEEKITKILSFILSRENFEVKSANNPKNGLKIAKENPIDLVITDIMMPGMNGYELGEELKKDPATAEVPFIFLTAKGEVADKFAGYFVGAADYLTKPFKTEELIEKVNRVLGLIEPDAGDDGTPDSVKARLVDSPASTSSPSDADPPVTPPIASFGLSSQSTHLSLGDVVDTYQCMLTALWAEVTNKIDPQAAADALQATLADLAIRYPLLDQITVSTSGPLIGAIKADLEQSRIDVINESLTELMTNFFERTASGAALSQEGVKVLLLDGNKEANEFYRSILTGAGFAIETIESGQSAVTAATAVTPDLILMNAVSEESDVFEICKQLKSSPTTANVPILMVSDLYDSESIKKSFAFGVSDYIVKPFGDSELVAAIISLIRE